MRRAKNRGYLGPKAEEGPKVGAFLIRDGSRVSVIVRRVNPGETGAFETRPASSDARDDITRACERVMLALAAKNAAIPVTILEA